MTMYLNFELIQNKGLEAWQVVLLAAIAQNKNEALGELIKSIFDTYDPDYLDALKEKAWVEFVKGKKGDTEYDRIRLSKKGKALLEEIETPPVEQEDKVVFDWLSNEYLKAGKEIGNKRKTLNHIRDFRTKSGICKNNLIKLCLAFLEDEENMQYNHVLEYSFYKAPTVFATKFNLEDSRLYKYYLKHKERLDKTFE